MTVSVEARALLIAVSVSSACSLITPLDGLQGGDASSDSGGSGLSAQTAGGGAGEGAGGVGPAAGGGGNGGDCTPGETVGCYTGPPGSDGVGICAGGTWTCESDGSGFGPCEGELTPGTETCAALADEDCDGEVNEEGAGCLCKPNLAMACYEGPAGTDQVGICASGLQACDETGTVPGPCVGQVMPALEDCTAAADEDCNGAANDHCALWSKLLGGSEDEDVTALVVGPNDEVLVVGDAYGSPDFGGGPLATAGLGDAFVVKLDAQGGHVWSKIFGDAASQDPAAVAVDAAGNVIVAGRFQGTLAFGVTPALTLISAGSDDAFVAKLAPDGTALWAKRFGDAAAQRASSVDVGPAGSIVTSGAFAGSIDLGAGDLPSAGADDGFVAKLDAMGNHVWSLRFGGGGNDEARWVDVDPMGATVITGAFASVADFGGGQLSSSAGTDVFVAKLDSNGGHVWSQSFPGAKDQRGSRAAVAPDGSIAVFGVTEGAIDFGSGPVARMGGGDLFLVKLSAAGAVSWGKVFGGALYQDAEGLAVAQNGDLVVHGDYDGTLDFGCGAMPVVPGQSGDLFVASLSSAGDCIWSRRFGGVGDQDAQAVALDSTGAIYLAVEHEGTVDFGQGALQSPMGLDDVCLAKLAP